MATTARRTPYSCRRYSAPLAALGRGKRRGRAARSAAAVPPLFARCSPSPAVLRSSRAVRNPPAPPQPGPAGGRRGSEVRGGRDSGAGQRPRSEQKGGLGEGREERCGRRGECGGRTEGMRRRGGSAGRVRPSSGTHLRSSPGAGCGGKAGPGDPKGSGPVWHGPGADWSREEYEGSSPRLV